MQTLKLFSSLPLFTSYRCFEMLWKVTKQLQYYSSTLHTFKTKNLQSEFILSSWFFLPV